MKRAETTPSKLLLPLIPALALGVYQLLPSSIPDHPVAATPAIDIVEIESAPLPGDSFENDAPVLQPRVPAKTVMSL